MVHLPAADAVGSDEVFVPAGWCLQGGDGDAYQSFPRRWSWIGDFALQRFAVTNAQYLAFLNALLDRGQEADALRHAPREMPPAGQEFGSLLYARGGDGRFTLRPIEDADSWRLDWPVCNINFFGANAYALWRREVTGLPWRLPSELEWEKAARGVDGRYFPWGDFLDPTWVRIGDSEPERPGTVAVDTYPTDVSVYGARGLGGNIRDWCIDPFVPLGPPQQDGRALTPEENGEAFGPFSWETLRAPPEALAKTQRMIRGGSARYYAKATRCAFRFQFTPDTRFDFLGLRLGRTIG